MGVNEALRIIGERWRVVLICLVLGLLGAGAALLVIPRQYTADVTLYVSLQGRAETSDDAYKASQLAKDRATSYAPLMRDERITQAVVDQLKLPMTAAQLSSHLAVTIQPDTAVMTETVTDTSPQRASAIANAVAQQFVSLVQQLEQPIGPTAAAGPVGVTPAAPSVIGVQVIRQATSSPIPISPNVPFGIALGGALGLLIGIAAAFVRHARDTSIRDPEQLHALTNAALLAEIPADRDARISPIAVDQAPGSLRAEAYRRLRTNLQFHDGAPEQRRRAKVIVVTSAVLGEGTSATACNLARTLAEGSHVMLIDANLRHPQVEAYFDLEPGPGLTTVLTGRLMWPFARRRLHEVPLDVLPSGPVAPRLGELLTWRGMDHLLEDLRARYDFVIIDVPALLPVSDAAAVAARADGVVLVVRYRRTTEEQVAAAASALEAVSAPLIGTVLTVTPARQARRRRLRAYPERPASLLPLLTSAPQEPQNGHPAEAGQNGRPAEGAVNGGANGATHKVAVEPNGSSNGSNGSSAGNGSNGSSGAVAPGDRTSELPRATTPDEQADDPSRRPSPSPSPRR
ncbi:MAG TPA: polysaccharide biosynthesis tyrosine autokinase [Pseudonocardia sp.]